MSGTHRITTQEIGKRGVLDCLFFMFGAAKRATFGKQTDSDQTYFALSDPRHDISISCLHAMVRTILPCCFFGLSILLVGPRAWGCCFSVGEFAKGCRQGLSWHPKVRPCDNLPRKLPHTQGGRKEGREGREGKGREGKGREGKGREGKGREPNRTEPKRKERPGKEREVREVREGRKEERRQERTGQEGSEGGRGEREGREEDSKTGRKQERHGILCAYTACSNGNGQFTRAAQLANTALLKTIDLPFINGGF